MTLEEIGKLEGISRQAVAEILNRAIKKLKIALAERGYTIKDFFE